MLLSEAIILGDSLKKCESMEFLTPDGSCGCALGGALLACGVNAQQFDAELKAGMHFPDRSSYQVFPEITAVKKLWPWLTEIHVEEISELYMRVARGTKTIEDVAAYVRSVEPAEQPQENIITAELVTA